MQKGGKSGLFMGEHQVVTPGINCYSACSSTRERGERHSRSLSGVHEDILNMSPRLSYHNPTISLDRRPHDEKFVSSQAITPGRLSSTSIASTEVPPPKSSAELSKEIAALELEVVHLERYLLSRYRAAFYQYIACSPTVVNHTPKPSSECPPGYLTQGSKIQKGYQAPYAVYLNQLFDKSNQSQTLEKIEESTSSRRHAEHPPAHDLPAGSDPKNDIPEYVFGRRCLADHLSASITDHVPDISCKLSEDIIRCISAIYCKLANPPICHIEPSASPTTSVSSSSTFSPRDPCENWSPQCHCEATASPCQFEPVKDKNGPYSDMVEISRICIDGNRFGYASKVLKIFSSLIRRLEKIDPRKMEHEEQLAFWINIHNALVMHAFLAYGLYQNHVKSTYSTLKAVYNVGGHSVNAYIIQSSILGCQPHRPSLWLRALFLPARKSMTGNGKHPYALGRPEPLAHFALCLGACSDPPVRLYTAKGIYEELNFAKAEFIQANALVQSERTIVLPKILFQYSKDASLELPDLLKMVGDCMPEAQRKSIQKCHKGRLDKCVKWSPYKSSFKYLVHRDLAKA